MRAEEGDESIRDYAHEAQEARESIGGEPRRTGLRELVARLFAPLRRR